MTPEQKFARLRDEALWNELRMPQPHAAAPARRSRMWQLIVPVVIGAVVAAVVIVGIASVRGTTTLQPAVPTSAATETPLPEPVPTRVEDEFLGAQGSAEAWKYDVYTFPRELPPGLEFPTSPPAGWFKDGQGYQAGITATQVAGQWVCAWEREYLAAARAGDESRQTAAMVEIDAYATLPAILANYPDAPKWREMTIAPALEGDLGPMLSEIAHTCSAPLAEIDAASGN